MNTMSLNAELFRQLSYIADDERYLQKAVKSIKRLVAQKEQEEHVDSVAKAETDYRPQTKEEILAGLDEAFKDAKLAREGKLQGQPLDEFLHELYN